MSELAKQRKELINDRVKDRGDQFPRPQKDSSQSKSNLNTDQLKEGSRDKSSDSNKPGTTSQMDPDQSKKMSEYEMSEEEKRKNKKKQRMIEKGLWEDPEQPVIISLGETCTNSILHIPSMIVPNDDEDAIERQKKVNKAYDSLLQSKIGSDNFSDHASQVLMMPMKHRGEMTVISMHNEGTKASHTQVYPFEVDREMRSDEKSPVELLNLEMKNIIEKEFEQKLKDPFGLIPTDLQSIRLNGDVQFVDQKREQAGIKGTSRADGTTRDAGMKATMNLRAGDTTHKVSDLHGGVTESNRSRNLTHHSNHQQKAPAVLEEKLKDFKTSLDGENKHLVLTEEEYKLYSSKEILDSIKFTERILNQAKYHKQYVEYRNYPEIDLKHDKRNEGAGLKKNAKNNREAQAGTDEDRSTPKILKPLFNFYHKQFEDRTVSSLDWNPINQDLLAATYGEFDLLPRLKGDRSPDNLEGYLAFWTLKNPEFPERLIRTNSRAMTCKFSPRNPNLIGVGMYDGVVAIYDIRKKGDQPIADSKELDNKHLDAVWVDSLHPGSQLDRPQQQQRQGRRPRLDLVRRQDHRVDHQERPRVAGAQAAEPRQQSDAQV